MILVPIELDRPIVLKDFQGSSSGQVMSKLQKMSGLKPRADGLDYQQDFKVNIVII